ncbi:MAG: hypothetical protein DWQ36_18670 [Acidobacteria bacterium]|nr:MAG: hypothetical protein DWQ36_18670 [Acidobacteriota bacterium]
MLALIAALLSVSSAGRGAAQVPGEAGDDALHEAWSDARIEEAIQDGCDRGHRLHTYRGTPNRSEVIGPLGLAERDEERARGVVLPTYLRLFLYGHHRRCRSVDLDDARRLAGPETWVVLWRTEDPYRGRSRMTSADQRVLRPTEVRLRHDGAWHHPIETRREDRWIKTWFGDDWNEEESLLAVFTEVPRRTGIHVEYEVEEGGSSYLTDSALFLLNGVPMKWWAMAHGEAAPEGPWWKR